MTIVQFFAGLFLMVAGAEALVRGASGLALVFGVSPLVVGLTVVAFGTSAPELAVSLHSVLSGQPDIATGNVVGSNIFNVLVILGISALIVPLALAQQVIRQEIPVMICVSILFWLLVADLRLDRWDAGLLLVLLAGYILFLIRQSRRERAAVHAEYEANIGSADSRAWRAHWAVRVGLVIAGLALLVIGARLLVTSAIDFARYLGVSELIIGLTIVAGGTSLPEVATSVVAAVRGERDIAVGNVVGSNLFNLLCVLGVTGVVAPAGLEVAASLLSFDIEVMVAVAVACLVVAFPGRIARWQGALFLAYYAAYTLYLILYAQQHDALQEFGMVMAGFVLPLTAITLLIVGYREYRNRRT